MTDKNGTNRAAGVLMAEHERTHEAIFASPIRVNIRWADIEALFLHLGATITEGSGSRVEVDLNGTDATFHRPHPQKEATKPMVRSVRQFLTDAGCAP